VTEVAPAAAGFAQPTTSAVCGTCAAPPRFRRPATTALAMVGAQRRNRVVKTWLLAI
jgi:hypothetical protein